MTTWRVTYAFIDRGDSVILSEWLHFKHCLSMLSLFQSYETLRDIVFMTDVHIVLLSVVVCSDFYLMVST